MKEINDLELIIYAIYAKGVVPNDTKSIMTNILIFDVVSTRNLKGLVIYHKETNKLSASGNDVGDPIFVVTTLQI